MDLAASIRAMAGGAPLPPYDRLMGFRLSSWAESGAVVEADADVRFANPTGALHGGLLAGLADSAMGITVSGLVGAGESCANTGLEIRFLRPGAHGALRAQARTLRRGRRTVAMECDVTDGAGRLVARASSTFLVLEAGASGAPARS